MADESVKCCICLDVSENLFFMPCCGSETSSIKYCEGCLKLMCSADSSSKETVGVCPICKKQFQIEFKVTSVKTFVVRGQCRMCCQGNKVLVSSDNLCENCLLGKSHPYRYECDRCGKKQVIPHPMWRYQSSPDQFGGATWACHQRCNDYTHWKIVAEDIDKIPSSLLPDTWLPSQSDAETSLAAVRDMIGKN